MRNVLLVYRAVHETVEGGFFFVKWFRHMTDLHSSPVMHDAINLFGHKAYACFLILEEIYGALYNDLDECGYLSLSLHYFCKQTFLSRKKSLEILTFFQGKHVVSYTFEGDALRVKIPDFIRLAGSWRIRSASADVAPVFSAAPAEGEEKGEKEGEEKKNAETARAREGISILNYLNGKTGKNFSDTGLVLDLLRGGRDPGDFIRIIDRKLKDPFFQKNPRLYNPRTLFGGDHFDLYLNEDCPAEKTATDAPAAGNAGFYLLKRAYFLYVRERFGGLQEEFRALLGGCGAYEPEEHGADILPGDLAAAEITGCTVTLFAESGFSLRHETLIGMMEERAGISVKRLYEPPPDFLESPLCETYVQKAREGKTHP